MATNKALEQLSDLRAEIRSLGATLGRTIAALEGDKTLATVEALRTLAKNSRAGDAAAARELAHAVGRLSAAEAFNQAMAFTLYFELLNLAEENVLIHRLAVRKARHRRGLGAAVA